MTKIGEGKEPKEPTVETYRHDVEVQSDKFLNALQSYQDATPDEKVHLKAVMDQSLALIKAAVSEIKLKGIHKKEVDVEKDYQTYMSNQTPENLSYLEEDISTLREYNRQKS